MNQNQTPSIEELSQAMGLGSDQVFDSLEVTRDPMTQRVVKGMDGNDASLHVRFTREAVYSKLESYIADKSGRTPKYVDVDFITISVPGDPSLTVHAPVDEYHKWRFPLEYKRFVEGQAQRAVGTPINTWPAVSPSQAKELEFAGVTTVEQLANLPDSSSRIILGFNGIRDQARAYVNKSADQQRDDLLQAELAKRDQELAELRAQMDSLMTAKKEAKPTK